MFFAFCLFANSRNNYIKIETMKTKILLSGLALSFAITANAQNSTDDLKKSADAATSSFSKGGKDTLADGWYKGGTFNLSVNEAGRNDYWVKGGEKSAIGIRGLVDYNFDRKKGKTLWLNSLRARYGIARNTSSGDKFIKNDDYFNFNSTLGKQFSKNWSYAGYFGLETQFDQYFLTPGYIKLGPAFLYKPNEHFSAVLSPLMANLTTKLAPSLKNVSLFGVDAGKTVEFGLGAFVQATANYDLCKGVNYKSVGTVFSNYMKNPGNLILDWNNLFTLTVNKYIGATISLNARYNDLEVSRVQLQHAIGVGLSYKL